MVKNINVLHKPKSMLFVFFGAIISKQLRYSHKLYKTRYTHLQTNIEYKQPPKTCKL